MLPLEIIAKLEQNKKKEEEKQKEKELKEQKEKETREKSNSDDTKEQSKIVETMRLESSSIEQTIKLDEKNI